MPAIEIRPAIATDIPVLIKFDHSYTTDHVWQMDLNMNKEQVGVRFLEIRLPRSVHVDYPRSPKALAENWKQRSGLLVALLENKPVGYVSLMQQITPLTTWADDLVVDQPLRRQGIGSALVLAAQEWTSSQTDSRRLVLLMQPKNQPAINLTQKLGFDFCGYDDHHYANNDIALFFAKWFR